MRCCSKYYFIIGIGAAVLCGKGFHFTLDNVARQDWNIRQRRLDEQQQIWRDRDLLLS
jgi:hypothetical protein